jgi:transposase
MMGRLNRDQEQLFYAFRLDEVVPEDHLVRKIGAVLDLSWVHAELGSYYSPLGRPSIDPVLMIRMLIVGYVFAIRSERAICREVQVNLAYRWFCGLSIEDKIRDHSAFSRARNERFRESDVFRRVFERVVSACIAAGLVGGEGPADLPVHSGGDPPAEGPTPFATCWPITRMPAHVSEQNLLVDDGGRPVKQGLAGTLLAFRRQPLRAETEGGEVSRAAGHRNLSSSLAAQPVTTSRVSACSAHAWRTLDSLEVPRAAADPLRWFATEGAARRAHQ